MDPNASLEGPPPHLSTYYNTLKNILANLDINSETKRFDLRNEDLKDLHWELGRGSVKKVEHIPTGTMMAKKIVLIDAKPSARKQILRELQIMHDCHSEYIVSFYGAYLAYPNICICTEFMDKGSLDSVYAKIGAIDIEVVGKVALAVLEGLTYLNDVHHIVHCDIKPSHILCNSRGEIKLCDFSASEELIGSIADTSVNTSMYTSPECIQGAPCTVKSDVWSLGISLTELALGRNPFSESPGDGDGDKHSKNVGSPMSSLDLLQRIVNEPAPRLTPERQFPVDANSFVDSCLVKDPKVRMTPKDLLKHPWIEHARVSAVDLENWASLF